MAIADNLEKFDIDIDKPYNVDFMENLTDDEKMNKIKQLMVRQHLIVNFYNIVENDEIDKINTKLLSNMYALIENTNFKDKLIEEYNSQFKKAPQLYDTLHSKEAKNNIGVTVNDNTTINIRTAVSDDIVTEDFRQILGGFGDQLSYDEKMQKLAFWSNKIAHECVTEIKELSDYFLDDLSNIKSEWSNGREKSPGVKFKNIIENMAYDRISKIEYGFDLKKILELVNSDQFSINNCKDEDFLKFKKLSEKYGLNLKDKEGINRLIHCCQMQDMCDTFFYIKDNAIENLIKYLDDPNIPESEKNVVMFKVNDLETKSNISKYSHDTGMYHSTSRIVIMNKEMYKEYCEFCSKGFITKKLIENYSISKGISLKDAKRELKEMFDGNEISENQKISLLAICGATVLHGNNIGIERIEKKHNIKIQDDCSPLMTSIAFSGTPVTPLICEKNIEKNVSQIREDNIYNKRKYNGDKKEFVNDVKQPVFSSYKFPENFIKFEDVPINNYRINRDKIEKDSEQTAQNRYKLSKGNVTVRRTFYANKNTLNIGDVNESKDNEDLDPIMI